MTSERVRIDRLLVERGLFESRAKAQAAIEAGLVVANEAPVTKASLELPADAVLRAEPAHPFVSRGGVKLAGGGTGSGVRMVTHRHIDDAAVDAAVAAASQLAARS